MEALQQDNMGYLLITGASSGVGREMAVYFSKYRDVIISGRNQERLLETKNLCDSGHSILAWNYDLSDIDNLETELGRFIKENRIEIDGMIYCAGYMKMLPLRAVTVDAMREIFSVNAFAPEIMIKTLVSRKYNKDSFKSAVMISSNISERGAAAFSLYGSSKAALDGIVRNLAVELAPKVRINSVLPGGMKTNMTKDIFADEKIENSIQNANPMGIGEPKQLIPMVELLLSDKASWITGQQIVIDGGRTTDITDR